MKGVYYLHINGDLIWKPKSVFYNTNVKDYFKSDFVLKYWIFPDEFTDILEFMGTFFLNALLLSTNKKITSNRIREINKWNNNIFNNNIIENIISKGCTL